jgi:RNA polymerase sigma-70 factor (ECF subfamily)
MKHLASTESPSVEGDSLEADDVRLLRKSAHGDMAAFHQLIGRHSDRLYRLAYSLVGNAADAEDVLQEASIGAFRGLGKFEERSSVKTWLTRILIVQAAKWRRDKKRSVATALDERNEKTVAGGSSGVDARIDLNAAMQKLTPEHREILVLREFEQLAYEEIAAILGVPRGTVESRLHRARAELKDRLKVYGRGSGSKE